MINITCAKIDHVSFHLEMAASSFVRLGRAMKARDSGKSKKEGFCWFETPQGTEFEIRKGLKGHKRHPDDGNSNRSTTEDGVTDLFMKS